MFLKAFVLLCVLGVGLASECDWFSWSICSEDCSNGAIIPMYKRSPWWTSHVGNGSDSCHTVCYNGGVLTNGVCVCPPRRAGKCCESVKLCSQDNGGCAETCMPNDLGSYCGCENQGSTLAADHISCTDANECDLDVCEYNCTNTDGSFICSCPQGYSLASDKTSCNDINECEPSQADCDHVCVNTPGSYICACRDGYRVHTSDSKACVDVNECEGNLDICEHDCTNTPGSFQCACREGYTLNKQNHHSCKDINECTGLANCEHKCVNNLGSFHCECRPGYKLSANGHTCQDDNECEFKDYDHCEHICTNTPGSFRCSCREGYKLNPDGFSCEEKASTTKGTTTPKPTTVLSNSGITQSSGGGFQCNGDVGLKYFTCEAMRGWYPNLAALCKPYGVQCCEMCKGYEINYVATTTPAPTCEDKGFLGYSCGIMQTWFASFEKLCFMYGKRYCCATCASGKPVCGDFGFSGLSCPTLRSLSTSMRTYCLEWGTYCCASCLGDI